MLLSLVQSCSNFYNLALVTSLLNKPTNVELVLLLLFTTCGHSLLSLPAYLPNVCPIPLDFNEHPGYTATSESGQLKDGSVLKSET